MKKFFIVFICFTAIMPAFALNGNKEQTEQIEILYSSYAEKIYNAVCIPYLSSIFKNKEPLFLKVLNNYETETSTIFDEFNYKVTENELVKYI